MSAVTPKPVTHQEALEALQRFVNGHFKSGGERPRISIPADPERDDDLRLTAYVARCRARIVELEQDCRTLGAECDYWRNDLGKVYEPTDARPSAAAWVSGGSNRPTPPAVGGGA